MTTSTRFKLIALFAFAAFISILQLDSAYADAHHANWLFYTLSGIFTAAGVYELVKLTKTTNG